MINSSVLRWVVNASTVTRLGNSLDFGQVLKPLATINLPKSPTVLGNFCKVAKIYHFLVKSFLGNFYRHLTFFSGHTVSWSPRMTHWALTVRWRFLNKHPVQFLYPYTREYSLWKWKHHCTDDLDCWFGFDQTREDIY